MSDTVQLDYDQLRDISGKFASEQQDIQKVLKTLEGQVEVLRSGKWKSDAATSYYNSMDSDVLPRVNKLIRALTLAQESVNQTVNNIRQADEANQNLTIG